MWPLIGGAAIVGLAYAGARSIYEHLNRRVKPDQIYTHREVARLLSVPEEEAVELIKSAQIRGQLVAKEYRVMGESIIDFLRTHPVVRIEEAEPRPADVEDAEDAPPDDEDA